MFPYSPVPPPDPPLSLLVLWAVGPALKGKWKGRGAPRSNGDPDFRQRFSFKFYFIKLESKTQAALLPYHATVSYSPPPLPPISDGGSGGDK